MDFLKDLIQPKIASHLVKSAQISFKKCFKINWGPRAKSSFKLNIKRTKNLIDWN